MNELIWTERPQTCPVCGAVVNRLGKDAVDEWIYFVCGLIVRKGHDETEWRMMRSWPCNRAMRAAATARARVAALESGAEAVERVRRVLQVWLHDQRPYITDEVAQLISEITAALTAPTVVAATAAVDTGGGGEGE